MKKNEKKSKLPTAEEEKPKGKIWDFVDPPPPGTPFSEWNFSTDHGMGDFLRMTGHGPIIP